MTIRISIRGMLCTLISGLWLLTGSYVSAAVAPEPVSTSLGKSGDCNHDDSVDISDVIFLMAYLFNADTEPSCPQLCDLNFDTKIDISDVIALQQYVLIDGASSELHMSTADCEAAEATTAAMAPAPPAITITVQPGQIEVITGDYRWVLSTTVFDVIHYASARNVARISPGRMDVDFLGTRSLFAAPLETRRGPDWVELRGWCDLNKHLWYVARYRFFAGTPFCRMAVTLTDRHDAQKTNDSFDPYWLTRLLSNLKLELGAANGLARTINQRNSMSYSTGAGPFLDAIGTSGNNWEWANTRPSLDLTRFQVLHTAGDGANQVVWRPMFVGAARLDALYTGYSPSEAYKNGKGVTYEVRNAQGVVTPRIVNLSPSRQVLNLGVFTLNTSSEVKLKATGTGQAIAGPLRVTPSNGSPAFELPMGARHSGVLEDGPIVVAVKDFWQHHPISLVRTASTIGWVAVQKPEVWMAGMGLTLETMISIDGQMAACVQKLNEPPTRAFPSWLDPMDGSYAQGALGARYDALIASLTAKYQDVLEAQDNFGWKNWGDYQISNSYINIQGKMQSWANLQYDLPMGLLTSWLRTGNANLWRYAQASVRHLMDIDTVKFKPFKSKYNGGGYRKGDMKVSMSHFGTEIVVPFTFGFRSLLLYYSLTGEEWARDVAKQSIDNLAYNGLYNAYYYVNTGGRDAAWILRGLLAGAKHFPNDPTYNYQQIADDFVEAMLVFYRANGRLPGVQPVWQGQMVEAMCQYHRATGDAEVAQAIVAHVRYLLTACIRWRTDGKYESLYCYGTNYNATCPTAQWVTDYDYPLLWLSSITYAFELTGDAFFSNWALDIFDYCEPKLMNETAIRRWTALLGFSGEFLRVFAASQ